MDANTARYIVRMIVAFRDNVLPFDATDKDDELIYSIRQLYKGGTPWEDAQVALVMSIAKTGVLGGDYIGDEEDITSVVEFAGHVLVERGAK